MEANITIDEVPGAVENICTKLKNTAWKNPSPSPEALGSPHFWAKKSVESAVKGKIAE
jgi:hypothetical protein